MRNAATVLNPWTTHHSYTCLTIRLLLPNTSTHIVKWICISTQKKVCTQTPKKSLVRPWKKASHPFVFITKKALQCAQQNLLSKCFTANDDSKKKENKINYKALKWTMISDHICSHETNFSVETKKEHNLPQWFGENTNRRPSKDTWLCIAVLINSHHVAIFYSRYKSKSLNRNKKIFKDICFPPFLLSKKMFPQQILSQSSK